MIQFKVRSLKKNDTEEVFYFPVVTNLLPSKMTEVVELIEKQCTLTRADVKSVLLALEFVVTKFLQAGHTVRLGNLGSFRPTIVSLEGAAEASQVSSKLIKAVRCRFTPSVAMQLSLQKDAVELSRAE